MLTLMMVVMITLLFLGFPMMIPLIAAPILMLEFFFPAMDATVLVQQMIGGIIPPSLIAVENGRNQLTNIAYGIIPPSLIAVPMFILAADIMTSGETADRMVNWVMRFVGHMRGGLAVTTTAACTIFGAISGSTQAAVVAIGGTMRPHLLKAGYDDSFSTALIINSSDIALLIPPSIGMIVFGVISGASVGELFIAGIGPGIFIFIMFSIYCYIYSRIKGIPTAPKSSWSDRWKASKKAALGFGFPVIIIGGIYTGIFSPTEAAAASVLYAAILEIGVYKNVKFSDIPDIALSTGLITAVVFILVAVGVAFSWVISFARIPQQILPVILGTDPSRLWILFVIAVAFFIGCMFVDPIVVIMILTPIFKPVALNAGIDLVLVGTVVTLQAAIGSATPPFGCDIFTAIAVFRRPYFDVVKGTPVFIAMLLIASATLIFFPELALFLRDLAFGY